MGQVGGLKDNIQFQIHLVPRYATKGAEAKEVIPVLEEVLEVAERLRKIGSEVIEKEEDDLNQLESQIEIIPKKK